MLKLNLNLNDKNVRDQLIERFLLAETSIEEERQLAQFYAAHPPLPNEEEATIYRLLQLQQSLPRPTPLTLSAEKEETFDAILASGHQTAVHQHKGAPAFLLGIAAMLVGIAIWILVPQTYHTPDQCPAANRITEVTPNHTYTETEIQSILSQDSSLVRQQRLLNVCDFYGMAATLFPDCDQINLEKKGNVILLTATRNDSINRYYIISTDDSTGHRCQITKLHLEE